MIRAEKLALHYRRSRGSDLTLFKELYKRHYESLLAFGLRFANQPAYRGFDVKEAVDATFAELHPFLVSSQPLQHIASWLAETLRDNLNRAANYRAYVASVGARQ